MPRCAADYLELTIPADDAERLFLIRRVRDGKFFRGASFWPWCRHWRDAAFTTRYVYDFVKHRWRSEEVVFIPVENVCQLEGEAARSIVYCWIRLPILRLLDLVRL